MPHDERRTARRFRTLKAAKLLPMDNWTSMSGVVRDQSQTGARIVVDEPHKVPDEFRLVVVKESTIQSCSVRWRDEQQLGVKYESDPKPAPPRKF